MKLFQSTLPMRGETPTLRFQLLHRCDFNPLSPCGERIEYTYKGYFSMDFNPLSPCGERQKDTDIVSTPGDFNPLSPCGERLHYEGRHKACPLFQSTLPMRGETAIIIRCNVSKQFQSTLPMRGETQLSICLFFRFLISIHSPHAGRDRIHAEALQLLA